MAMAHVLESTQGEVIVNSGIGFWVKNTAFFFGFGFCTDSVSWEFSFLRGELLARANSIC
jgi:hypothetical protein